MCPESGRAVTALPVFLCDGGLSSPPLFVSSFTADRLATFNTVTGALRSQQETVKGSPDLGKEDPHRGRRAGWVWGDWVPTRPQKPELAAGNCRHPKRLAHSQRSSLKSRFQSQPLERSRRQQTRRFETSTTQATTDGWVLHVFVALRFFNEMSPTSLKWREC